MKKGLEYEIEYLISVIKYPRKKFNEIFLKKIDKLYRNFMELENMNEVSSKLITMKIMNLILAKYEYYHGYVKLLSKPIFIKFDSSNICQLQCPKCAHSPTHIGYNYWALGGGKPPFELGQLSEKYRLLCTLCFELFNVFLWGAIH